MPSAKRHAAVLLTLLVVLAACDSDRAVAPGDPAGQPPTLDVASQQLPPGRVRTFDDDFTDLAGEIPGFGGFFYDEDGTLTVRLKDPGQSGLARSRIGAFLSLRAGGNTDRLARIPAEVAAMRVMGAGYDFRELRAWYRNQVVPGVNGGDGVTMTDIDERQNRIVIGVLDMAKAPSLMARLRDRGVPEDAMEVVPFAGISVGRMTASMPFQTPPFSVQSKQRPVPGGMQVQFINALGKIDTCTLGYNVRPDAGADPTRYFLTNSHCTMFVGTLNSMSMGQSTVNDLIGDEFADPQTFTSSQDPACPATRLCRYSDAALFKYTVASNANHGKVALPAVNSLTANGFVTVNYETSVWVGAVVHKVGRTTGNTFGQVQQTCEVMSIGV